jgi:hypothetical protein
LPSSFSKVLYAGLRSAKAPRTQFH